MKDFLSEFNFIVASFFNRNLIRPQKDGWMKKKKKIELYCFRLLSRFVAISRVDDAHVRRSSLSTRFLSVRLYMTAQCTQVHSVKNRIHLSPSRGQVGHRKYAGQKIEIKYMRIFIRSGKNGHRQPVTPPIFRERSANRHQKAACELWEKNKKKKEEKRGTSDEIIKTDLISCP